MNKITSILLGRKVKIQYVGSDNHGTIVAVYIDRGEPILLIENCEGGLYTMNATAAQLEPVSYTVSGVQVRSDLSPFKEPNNPS